MSGRRAWIAPPGPRDVYCGLHVVGIAEPMRDGAFRFNTTSMDVRWDALRGKVFADEDSLIDAVRKADEAP